MHRPPATGHGPLSLHDALPNFGAKAIASACRSRIDLRVDTDGESGSGGNGLRCGNQCEDRKRKRLIESPTAHAYSFSCWNMRTEQRRVSLSLLTKPEGEALGVT